jgi:ribonuclease G
MEAAREIAVQIRLRNIGGIVVIDFIDMSRENNEKLNHEFRKHLAKDDRKMTIGGFTTLGNFELTRIRKGVRLETYYE